VLQPSGNNPLEIQVKTRRGEHWARIYAFADPRQPDRLGDNGAVPLSSELGWFLDGSYAVIVLGNYDLPGASAIYQKLIGFLALQ
jgi:hypothetical protein